MMLSNLFLAVYSSQLKIEVKSWDLGQCFQRNFAVDLLKVAWMFLLDFPAKGGGGKEGWGVGAQCFCHWANQLGWSSITSRAELLKNKDSRNDLDAVLLLE